MRNGWLAALFLMVLPGSPTRVIAQEEPVADVAGSLNLFFDCQGSGCFDLDFFRREIPYVSWVRDREVSDVHVLVTSQSTGGGGREHQLSFIGRRAFEGVEQQLTVSTGGDATTDEIRTALAERLALGLVRYLMDTPVADRLRVTAEAAPGAEGERGVAQAQQDDPWNFWVFRIGLNGFLNGESSQSFSNLNGSGSANRTTEDWKFNLAGRYSRNTNRFEIDDTTTEHTVREEWSSDLLLVKTLTDHWSAGARGGVGGSTFRNEQFRWTLSPGFEYNVFPYAESSRRSFTFQALLNARYWDYDEITIYDRTEELRFAASLTGSLELVQPWGRVSVSLTESHYLHDPSKYQASVFGSMQVRLFRGFSVNVTGNYARIHDQLGIPAGDYTTAEILLRQRQLATAYSYFMSFGISYRFGSIFNNVVNPRFDGGSVFFF